MLPPWGWHVIKQAPLAWGAGVVGVIALAPWTLQQTGDLSSVNPPLPNSTTPQHQMGNSRPRKWMEV